MNETTWDEYNIKRLSIDLISDLAILYQAVYGKTLPHKYFQLKYDTAFTGISDTAYLAYDTQGCAVAFFGVIPCFIQYDGYKILAAQAVDAMTHPSHRNKGLFVELAALTIELCRLEGVSILFGFPNQYSARALIDKLHWSLIGHMAYFNLPVKTFPLEKIVSKFHVFRGIYERYVTHQIDKYKLSQSGLAFTLFDDSFAGVCRDDDYLEYKTYNQTVVIKMHGADVWLKVNNGLIVGDMTISQDSEKVIRNLKNLARKLGLTQVMFQVSVGTPLYNLLQHHAQPQPGFPIIIKDLGSGIQTDKLKFTFADIDIF